MLTCYAHYASSHTPVQRHNHLGSLWISYIVYIRLLDSGVAEVLAPVMKSHVIADGKALTAFALEIINPKEVLVSQCHSQVCCLLIITCFHLRGKL